MHVNVSGQSGLLLNKLMMIVLITGFEQPLQINDLITLHMLPFIPLHFLCTHL